MLGGVVGILYVVLKLILFVGLVIFTLECLCRIADIHQKNSDVKWKEKD